MSIRTIEQVKTTLTAKPPSSCALNVGDTVTYTNCYGVSFEGNKIIGFGKEDRIFIYLDFDCYWCPVSEDELTLTKRGLFTYNR